MLRALVVCSADADSKVPDLFRLLAENGFQTTHCESTDDAIGRYFSLAQDVANPNTLHVGSGSERPFFDVVVTKLGRESQGSSMNGNHLLQAVQACHGKRTFLVVWSFSASSNAAMRWHLSVNGANMVTYDLESLRTVLVKIAWIKLTGTLVADPTVETESLAALPTLGDLLREVGPRAAENKDTSGGRPELVRSKVLEAFWKRTSEAPATSALNNCFQATSDGSSQAMEVDSPPPVDYGPGGRHAERSRNPPRQKASFRRPELFACPFCGMQNLTEDALWLHSPLYHINFRPQAVRRSDPPPQQAAGNVIGDISRSSPSSSPVRNQAKAGIASGEDKDAHVPGDETLSSTSGAYISSKSAGKEQPATAGGGPVVAAAQSLTNANAGARSSPARPLKMTCPVCLSKGQHVHREENLQYHIRNAHGPCDPNRHSQDQLALLSEYTTSQRPPSLNAFALVVCVDTREGGLGKMLLVQEFASSGYWLPGGRVDPGESLEAAAIRECEEEAGVAIELVGVLQMQYRNSNSVAVASVPAGAGTGNSQPQQQPGVQQGFSTTSNVAGAPAAPPPSRSTRNSVRLRVIYYARPKFGGSTVPKTIPDYESAGACWIRLDDPNLEKLPYRGSEPIFWANYIRNGGAIYPMGVISGREN